MSEDAQGKSAPAPGEPERGAGPAEQQPRVSQTPPLPPRGAEASRAAGSRSVAEKPENPRERRGERPAGSTLNRVRAQIASLVWLVAVVAALVLSVGALCVALRLNQENALVGFVTETAGRLDFGEFKSFTGADSEVKEALVNWGIAAVLWLVAGKVLDKLIRP